MITKTNTNNLFAGVRTIVSNQRKIERLKGERFNIFSILKMETKENETHSAFLAELLSPKGTHLMGNAFLKLFLERIGLSQHLDVDSTKVETEYYLGKRNLTTGNGGRVDIYLSDKNGMSVCIENKIYAGDQEKQILRYCAHNNSKNKVFYLTLDGHEPSEFSKGTLKSGVDFYNLSYETDITEWLHDCIKEAAEAPILRESLKQYEVLIKKLTMTTDNELQQQLNDLILSNFEESAVIASNFNKAKYSMLQDIRTSVIRRLTVELGDAYKVSQGVAIEHKYAQVWIEFADALHSKNCFGIETFNGDGNFDGRLFIGIYNDQGKESPFAKEQGGKLRWWYDEHFVKFEEKEVNLRNNDLLKTLTDLARREALVSAIVTEAKEYIAARAENVRKYIGAAKASV